MTSNMLYVSDWNVSPYPKKPIRTYYTTADNTKKAFGLRGIVVEGYKRGRRLGLPTANLALESLSMPIDQCEAAFKEQAQSSDGVYYGLARVEGISQVYKVVMTIGYNPFFKNVSLSIEAHLINFPEHLMFYGRRLSVLVCGWVRSMLTIMSSEEQLVAAILTDKRYGARMLNKKIFTMYYEDPWIREKVHDLTYTLPPLGDIRKDCTAGDEVLAIQSVKDSYKTDMAGKDFDNKVSKESYLKEVLMPLKQASGTSFGSPMTKSDKINMALPTTPLGPADKSETADYEPIEYGMKKRSNALSTPTGIVMKRRKTSAI